MKSYQIGDRYQFNQEKDIWEIISFNEDKYPICVCIDVGVSYYDVGDKDVWTFSDNYCKYLGNFSKSNNFTELYNILK